VAWYQSRLKQVDQFIQENTTTAIKPLYTPQNNNTPVYLLNGAQAPNQDNGIVGIYIKDGKKYMKVQ
jgi:hypothetical protein